MKHVFSVIGASLGIALAVAACDDSQHHGWRDEGNGEGAGSCSSFTNCNTCTAANGCGWCFDSSGTGTCGDDANQCSTEWTWESNYCRAAADASVATTSDAASPDSSTDASEDASDAASDADVDAAGDE